MEHWYILQTKPGHERQVAVHLHQRGIEVYLPLIWGNTGAFRSIQERAYFPRYLFARVDLAGRSLQAIRWSPGVRGLVEYSGEPLSMSDEFLDELRQRLSRVRTVGGMNADGARPDTATFITEGPFAGFEGIFSAHVSGAERSRTLIACAYREAWKPASKRQSGTAPKDAEGKPSSFD